MHVPGRGGSLSPLLWYEGTTRRGGGRQTEWGVQTPLWCMSPERTAVLGTSSEGRDDPPVRRASGGSLWNTVARVPPPVSRRGRTAFGIAVGRAPPKGPRARLPLIRAPATGPRHPRHMSLNSPSERTIMGDVRQSQTSGGRGYLGHAVAPLPDDASRPASDNRWGPSPVAIGLSL